MPTSLFVSLDTNILFRYVTQGQPGCEQEHWDVLVKAMNDSTVALLIAETVILEFEKTARDLERRLRDEAAKAAVQLGEFLEQLFKSEPKNAKGSAGREIKVWNELGDLASSLQGKMGEWVESKVAESVRRLGEVNKFLSGGRFELLSFDQDLMLRTARRKLAARHRDLKGEKFPEGDYLLIDSLVRRFEREADGCELLFCSENKRDFGLGTEKETLHPSLSEGLPPARLFSDLASLAAVLKSQKPIELPTPEEVEEAVRREEAERRSEADKEAFEAWGAAVVESERFNADLLRLIAEKEALKKSFLEGPYSLNEAMKGIAAHKSAMDEMYDEIARNKMSMKDYINSSINNILPKRIRMADRELNIPRPPRRELPSTTDLPRPTSDDVGPPLKKD